jgi:diguanylate cyclase (GGDEF)-like protein
MEVLSPAVATGPGPRRLARVEDELARLQAQVARLEAECAALQWAVGHDELTGLANRGMFCALAPPLLGTGRPAVVTVLDLNGFKPVNDRWGHDVGDAVLRIVAQRLAGCTGYDLVARLSGDEFTGIVTGRPDVTGNWWRPAVHALVTAIAEPMPVAGHTVQVTASVGVAPAGPEVPIDELLHRADLTMYRAKAGGGGVATWSEPCVEFTLSPMARYATAPTFDPYRRNRAALAPAGSYLRDDPVWVYRDGSWRPGVVECASRRAVLVTYRLCGGTGTVVDTMTAEYVVARDASDPQLDRRVAA